MIKSYTDLEQSKKLAGILPLESADMEYLAIKENGQLVGSVPFVKDDSEVKDSAYSHTYDRIACWSLAVLLEILHYPTLSQDFNHNWTCNSFGKEMETVCDWEPQENAVDAAYKMIIKLHEKNLL